MQSNLADTNPVDNEFSWAEPIGLFDPAPIPTGNGSKRISSVIEEHASWLQAAPRTSLSIVFNLFPGSIRRMGDALDMIVLVSGYHGTVATPQGTPIPETRPGTG